MNNDGLRAFLKKLEDHGELVTIDRPVALDFEFASVVETMLQERRPIGLFTNVDHPSKMALVGGVLGDIRRIALALDCTEQEMNDRLTQAQENLIDPVVVDDAPFRENQFIGEDVRLQELLPIPRHNEGDGGAFITGGIMITKDPVSGRQNYSFNRLQVKGDRKVGVVMNEWRHIARFYRDMESRDMRLPCAVAIGVDPAVEIAAGFRIEEDEGALAGAINGRALELAACATVDLLVPAAAEIVVEGFIRPHLREDEGPLAEFTGHYGEIWKAPVMDMTAVSFRNGAVYQTIVPASFEHVYIGNVLPREPMLKKMVSHVSPNILDVHLTPYSGGFLAVISIDKKNAGEPKNIGMAALMTHVNIKMAVVVDGDVDIYNPSDVLWAISTRVDANRDILIAPYAQGMENDPTTGPDGTHTKMSIDATIDLKIRDDYRRVRYPKVDLSQYYPGGSDGGPGCD